MLSRLLVDVHLDSSQISESLLSRYQTTLIETAFLGDASNRDKCKRPTEFCSLSSILLIAAFRCVPKDCGVSLAESCAGSQTTC